MTLPQKRILLGQLNSNGDCLYATAVARQIKADYPGCHLTWAVGSMCRSVLDGNPHVDEVWEIPLTSVAEIGEVWPAFVHTARTRIAAGEFDEMFITQISPDNLHLYDGIIRSTIFRGYGKPITVPIEPVLRLSATEVENVRRFAEFHRLADQDHVVLFECSAASRQSFVTLDFALDVSRQLVAKVPRLCVILSSDKRIQSGDERIVDGSVLTLRENAELTKYCSLLIGGSSGISWIATSDWAKPLPMIQLIKADAVWFASFVQDYECWGLATDTIIEMSNCNSNTLFQCVETALTEGFSATKSRFHERVSREFDYFNIFLADFLSEGQYRKATRFLLANIQKHGLRYRFVYGYFYHLVNYSTPPAIMNAGRYLKSYVSKASHKLGRLF